MDPSKIELSNLSKSFEYQKLASQIDKCDDISALKDFAKSAFKLYFKQQETMKIIGIENGQ